MEKISIKETNYFTVGYCPECGSVYVIGLEDIEPYYYGRHCWTCPKCKTLIFLDEYHEEIYERFDKLDLAPPASWCKQNNCNGKCKHCKDVSVCYEDVLDKKVFNKRKVF